MKIAFKSITTIYDFKTMKQAEKCEDKILKKYAGRIIKLETYENNNEDYKYSCYVEIVSL